MTAPTHSRAGGAGLRQHTPTPWTYRPSKHDDWGWIRDAEGALAASARDGRVWSEQFDEYRAAGKDPYEPNAAFIVEAVNNYAALQARVEELTKALEPFAEIAKELVPTLTDDYKNTMAWAVPTVGQLREALKALAMPLEDRK